MRVIWFNAARLLAVTALLIAALSAATAPARAADTIVTVEIETKVPVLDVAILGVVMYEMDCSSSTEMSGSWYFDGTVDGASASSSGSASGNWDGSQLNTTITGIDTWEMPGIGRPAVPFDTSASSLDGVVYLTRENVPAPVPQAIDRELGNPCDGGATSYRVSSPASGGDEVGELPQTGGMTSDGGDADAPVAPALLVAALVAGGGSALRRAQRSVG